jgi:hypothetical protein
MLDAIENSAASAPEGSSDEVKQFYRHAKVFINSPLFGPFLKPDYVATSSQPNHPRIP